MSDDKFADSKRRQIIDSKTFDRTYYDPISTSSQMERNGTTHVSVIGPDGDAVAVTSTVSLCFGSKVVGRRTGIIFNDEMRTFSLPNTVTRYGCPHSHENGLKPSKRPVTSMCPSVVVDKAGDVKLVIGAAGACRIPTAAALVTMETLWFNWSLKEAIDYPRIHHQLYP